MTKLDIILSVFKCVKIKSTGDFGVVIEQNITDQVSSDLYDRVRVANGAYEDFAILVKKDDYEVIS